MSAILLGQVGSPRSRWTRGVLGRFSASSSGDINEARWISGSSRGEEGGHREMRQGGMREGAGIRLVVALAQEGDARVLE